MRDNNKRELILDAAERLLCQISDKDISVEKIAKEAGIGKGSIYYYFESKDDIVNAVIERSYALAIEEYFSSIYECDNALDRIQALFRAIIKQEFSDERKNIIIYFHLQDDLTLHMKMMMTAIKTLSPILQRLLEEGTREGSLYTEYSEEGAEMIVAMLTLLLDNTLFPGDNESRSRKLRMYAGILEVCLRAEHGSFDFLFSPEAYKQAEPAPNRSV
ncbi:MAG: TetR/AcrR family transcriptional regulator [Oscillospiraceae bacterium]|nr:TetR/AcrR family transcriptional regulator [Oscillospiraceae bacterium]